MVATMDAPIADQILEASGTWWLAEVCRRWEERLIRDVSQLGGLPVSLKEHIRRIEHDDKGRRYVRTVEKSLFPHAVFLCVPCDDPRDCFTSATNHLSRVSLKPIPAQRTFVEQISTIAIGCDNYETHGTTTFKPNQRVRIVSGPLIGKAGFYDRTHKGLIYLWCQMMGACTIVNVPAYRVEPE